MFDGEPVHEVEPAADDVPSFQIDSDEYDSEASVEDLDAGEYDRLVEEAENGFSEDEVDTMVEQLKQRGLVQFLIEYLKPAADGTVPSLRKLLLSLGIIPPAPLRHPSVSNLDLMPFARVALSRILRRRERLAHLSTVDQALALLRDAKNIIVLSGAGISTSCGIPDFRSADGLYAQLQAEGKFDLDDPHQMFDISFFRERPEVFYAFAKQIYPSNFVPSPCHRWIKMLEDRGVLLRNYTQNIDTLESQAGVIKVLQCHGSFATASCLRCMRRVPGKEIEPYVMASEVPQCPVCVEQREKDKARRQAEKASKKAKGKASSSSAAWGYGDDADYDDDQYAYDEWGGGEPGIMKPDITFFGQALSLDFDRCLLEDRDKVDLLVIIGTSLKVAPVSEVLTHIPHSVPQIFINMTPVAHVQPDICLLGDGDSIVSWIADQLGWRIPPPALSSTAAIAARPPRSLKIPPEDAIWETGVGPLQNVHLLSSKRDKAKVEAAMPVDDNNPGETTARPVQGASADMERPPKRPRPDTETVEGVKGSPL